MVSRLTNRQSGLLCLLILGGSHVQTVQSQCRLHATLAALFAARRPVYGERDTHDHLLAILEIDDSARPRASRGARRDGGPYGAAAGSERSGSALVLAETNSSAGRDTCTEVTNAKRVQSAFSRKIKGTACKCTEKHDDSNHAVKVVCLGPPEAVIAKRKFSLAKVDKMCPAPAQASCLPTQEKYHGWGCRFLDKFLGALKTPSVKWKWMRYLDTGAVSGLGAGIAKFFPDAVEAAKAAGEAVSFAAGYAFGVGLMGTFVNLMKVFNALFCGGGRCLGFVAMILVMFGVFGAVLFFCPGVAVAIAGALAIAGFPAFVGIASIIMATLVRYLGPTLCGFISGKSGKKLPAVLQESFGGSSHQSFGGGSSSALMDGMTDAMSAMNEEQRAAISGREDAIMKLLSSGSSSSVSTAASDMDFGDAVASGGNLALNVDGACVKGGEQSPMADAREEALSALRAEDEQADEESDHTGEIEFLEAFSEQLFPPGDHPSECGLVKPSEDLPANDIPETGSPG